MKKRKKMTFIGKLWRLLKPFRADFYRIFIITAIFETVRTGGPYLFGKILDLLVKTNGVITFNTAFYIVGGLAGVRLISLIIDYITDIAIMRLLWSLERHISTTSFAKLLELSLDYHEAESTGTKINIVNRGKDKLVDLIANYTWDFQPTVLQIVITAIMIFLTSWRIGIVFVVSIVPFIVITLKTYESTRKWRAKRHDAYETSSSEIGDTITNITVVKAFAQERRENKSFQSIWDFIRNVSIIEYKRHVLAGFGRSLLVEVFYLMILLAGMAEIQNRALTVGSLVFLINLIERAYSNVYRVGRIYERAVDASESVDRITNLMQKNPTVVNCANPVMPEKIAGQISFKHVAFAYKKRRVLRNITFTVPAGSFTAIVGKSGSGKSTVAKLISRYYDPTRGTILIDGKYDLRQLDIDFFRQKTAVVFQDSPVPNRKIWEIISYAAGQKNFHSVADRVFKAAKLANAYDFITEYENGFQTEVGERGVRLSGGQKQRLAIARALFAEPKILIMDEPTSHLDSLSEALIQEALVNISKERSLTKIVIAHRLSTVQQADQILVMDRGRLIEHGTHKQLLAKNGTYAEIVRQSELKS